MKRIVPLLISMLFIINVAYAGEGSCGYEGGISAENQNAKTLDYREYTFITGKPVLLTGTLEIKTSLKNNSEVSTYKYTLKNTDLGATLTRSYTLETTLVPKDNGQTLKTTKITKPIEKISVDKKTYNLKQYSFTKSNVVDKKAVGEYFAGNIKTFKEYSYSLATGVAEGSTTIDGSGEIYGYNQYWGDTESYKIDYIVSNKNLKDNKKNWGLTYSVSLNSNSQKKLYYQENRPTQISFDGGYVLTQNNVNTLDYSYSGPEFNNDIPTDFLISKSGSEKFDTFPNVQRLLVPDSTPIKGHWAEGFITRLFSLEIFEGNISDFKPNNYITRAQFAKALVRGAKIDMPDFSQNSTNTTKPVIYSDVSTDSTFYDYIYAASKNGVIEGTGSEKFNPNGYLTRAEAITMLVRALGFQNQAPTENPVTNYNDNDSIPTWARKSIYVADKIGIIKGDTYGNVNPNKNLTNGEVSALLDRYIEYLKSDIAQDYKSGI